MTRTTAFLSLPLLLLLAGTSACVTTHHSEVGPFVRTISSRADRLSIERCEVAYTAVIHHGPNGSKRAKLSDGNCSETDVRLRLGHARGESR